MTTKLNEMWAALSAHKPDASYADAWATMCREQTDDAALEAAYEAAPVCSAAERAALWAAWAVKRAARVARAAAWADKYAQEAIDALREVKP